MNFRPLHDRVLVRRVTAEEKTSGGIIIPDTAKEKPQEGEVVSVGTGTRGEDGTVTPLDVKAGDTLLWDCHIINDGDVGLTYTNEVKTGEMCNLWGATVGPKVNCVHFLLEQPFTIQ